MKIRKLLLTIAVCTAPLVHAQELITELNWRGLQEAGQLLSGVIDLQNGELHLEGQSNQAAHRWIVAIDTPGIEQPVYAVRGKVRYEGVVGDAYLQMNNFFGDAFYFSKTLALVGPMAKITGESPSRDFVVPFFIAQDDSSLADLRPTRLEFGLFLPGAGSVYLSDVAVYQYEAGENPMLAAHASMDLSNPSRKMGLIGGVAGALIGVGCALAGMLASVGRARAGVMFFMRMLPIAGFLSLVYAAYMFFVDAAPVAYYTIGLLGLLSTVIGLTIGRVIDGRYAEYELRKINALDLNR